MLLKFRLDPDRALRPLFVTVSGGGHTGIDPRSPAPLQGRAGEGGSNCLRRGSIAPCLASSAPGFHSCTIDFLLFACYFYDTSEKNFTGAILW